MKIPIKVSRIRVAFQVAVHLLIILHLLGYYFYNWKKLGSLEFQTFYHDFLGKGVLTAGAALTAFAFLLTLTLGRVFCSWGCHFGAFQDLAAWTLRKLRVPLPFLRTRFLHWAPYALLLGIFLWSPVERWIAQGEVPAPRLDLAANSPLGTLPGWLGAIVLFLTCGAGLLLFLGTRGFCRFICPYGASFRILEPLAPFRVRKVKACGEGCGLPGSSLPAGPDLIAIPEAAAPCTLACPTAVDVHEEAATWGAVYDRDCIRCHLCIEACPNHALGYRGKPLAAYTGRSRKNKPRRPPYTLPLSREILVSAVTVASFLAWDLSLAAHFLAGALALGEGFLALLAFEILARPDLRFGRLALRRGGRWTFAGATALGLFVLSWAPLLQGGAFKVLRHQGDRAFSQLFPRLALDDEPLEGASRLEDQDRGGDFTAEIAMSPGPARPAVLLDRPALLEEARQSYDLALRVLPNHLSTWRRQIFVLVERGDSQALEAAGRLLAVDPGPGSEALHRWVEGRLGGRTGAGATGKKER
ncbi:MAG: 4Fe-4S binding protein [Planctomycetes bacterium]|nr:4Fe-4S binding protein [Planctomycetota bacterium]